MSDSAYRRRCAGLLRIAPAPRRAEPPPGAPSCSGCHAANRRRRHRRAAARRPQRRPRSSPRCRRSAPGQRPSTVMDRIAKGFTDDEIQAIAAWYAEQKYVT